MTQRDALGQKLHTLLQGLDESFLERRDHVRMALLSVLSGQHMLLIGPPGTAKSLLARALCQCIAETEYFEYLLSRFTHPDELFGPVSIPGLKEEDYRRLTTGYLPQAHVAFLDEIFKANSAILNSLLTLINERIFHHGTHRDPVPLLGLLGASNETPDPEGGLGALYDRFLVRMPVHPLADPSHFLRVSLGDVPPFSPPQGARLLPGDLAHARQASACVDAPPEVRDALVKLREALREEHIEASDRRWRWAVSLLKMAAWTSGRQALSHVDLLLLQHCFGNPGETDVTVGRLVREVIQPTARVDEALAPLVRLWNKISTAPDAEMSLEEATDTRLAWIQDLQTRADQVAQEIAQTRDQVMQDFEGSMWVLDPPPETLAAFIAARRRIQVLRDAADGYQKSLQNFRLDEGFLREMSRNTGGRRRARNFYEEEDEPVLWLSARGASPDTWIPLLIGGTLSQDKQLLATFTDSVKRWLRNNNSQDPWHKHVLVAELDNDLLFAWRRAPEFSWSGQVQTWFDALWASYHEDKTRRPPTWDQETAKTRFTQLMERLRWVSLEVFPEAPLLPGEQTS